MEEKNVFSDVNAEKKKITSSIKKTVVNHLPYILLGIILFCRVLLEIFHTSIVNPFTPIFFLETAISVGLTIFCYIVFIPQGRENEIANSLSYKPNCARWGELSGKIRIGGMLDQFRKYCTDQLEFERREIKMLIIGNNTALSFEEYNERYSHLSRETLKAMYAKGSISKDEYYAIKKCNGRIKVKPINPVLILSGVAKSNFNDAGRDESSYIFKWLAKKPIYATVFSVVARGISGSFVGFNPSAIYGMLLDIISIIMASFVGYGAGEQSVRDKEDRIKNRIIFLESFFEKNK